MKSTALLTQHHRQAESLFAAIHSAPSGAATGGQRDRRALVEELAAALTAHMIIEEELFYPVARGPRPDVIRNEEEHELDMAAMRRLLATPDDDENFLARVMVIEDITASHIAREEGDLFQAIDQVLSPTQNDALGATMQARFDELMKLDLPSVMAQRRPWTEGITVMPGGPGMGAMPSMPGAPATGTMPSMPGAPATGTMPSMPGDEEEPPSSAH